MSEGQRLVILGTGAFAEEVADLVEQGSEFTLAAFAENLDRSRCSELLLGLPIVWVDDLEALRDDHVAVCAIGTTRREVFLEQARRLELRFGIVRHPAASVSPRAELGAGCIVGAGVIVATRARIGEHVILNRGALIGHHTTIGNRVTISPGANVAGRCNVGDGTYIAMGAVILNDLTIGEGAVISAGSVVTRDVPARALVRGVPARIVKEDVEPF